MAAHLRCECINLIDKLEPLALVLSRCLRQLLEQALPLSCLHSHSQTFTLVLVAPDIRIQRLAATSSAISFNSSLRSSHQLLRSSSNWSARDWQQPSRYATSEEKRRFPHYTHLALIDFLRKSMLQRCYLCVCVVALWARLV